MASTIFVHVVAVFLFLPMGTNPSTPSQTYVNTRSPHGNLNIPCQNCHTVEGWKPIRAVPEFDHNQTKFPLRGMHQGVACTQCHTKPVFTNVGTRCADCHADIHKRQFGATCEQCHTVRGWQVSITQIKDHDNRFPLVGAHRTLDCDSCHRGAAVGQFQGLSTQCYSCHAKDYQATNGPSHVATGFPTSCEQCHSMDSWVGAKFDHLKLTGFALTGAHTGLDCSACHVGGQFKGTAATCVGCHMKDFQGTNNPNHVSLAFPQTCQSCHNTTAWQPANFDHNSIGFPLTGAHASLQCSQCHTNNNYNLTSTQCVSCHLQDYQNTNNPAHAQAGFPQTCQSCHSTVSWDGTTFNHATTGFNLTGAHASVQCSQCHVNNNYNLTSGACVTCHLKDYQSTTNPNHVQSAFPQTCESCHSTVNWLGATFNHATTGFALTGAHTSLQCTQCHVNNNYNLTSGACVTCHLQDFQSTTNPNHVQAAFPQTCESCHSTVNWLGATFNHASTGFALTGAHTSLQCTQCHVNNNYTLTSGACVTCHLQDFQGATNPNHVQSGFPQQCDSCHTTVSWLGATFNHNSTGFPLTGAHTSVQCTQCHVNNNYNLTNTACVSCHLNDFNTTNNPSHTSAGFPQQCELCHNTTAWIPSSFNHNNTPFPLTGAHTTVPCANCHVNNNYTTLPTDCYSCHKADYNTTTNPNHTAAGFPTTCQTCHSTTSWLGATFNHTFFPLNHGNANGVCSTCHTNPNDFTVFQCTNCHLKAQTDSNHQGVRGYVYNSINCYQCHQNGRAGG